MYRSITCLAEQTTKNRINKKDAVSYNNVRILLSKSQKIKMVL